MKGLQSKRKADVIELTQEELEHKLHDACNFHSLSAIAVLVEKGVSITPHMIVTVLKNWVAEKSPCILFYLLSQEMNVYAWHEELSILHHALRLGLHEAVIMILTKRASDVDSSCGKNGTPIVYCIKQKLDRMLLKILIDHGANRTSALRTAIQEGLFETTRFLFDVCGVRVTAGLLECTTNLQMIDYLLSRGAAPDFKKAIRGNLEILKKYVSRFGITQFVEQPIAWGEEHADFMGLVRLWDKHGYHLQPTDDSFRIARYDNLWAVSRSRILNKDFWENAVKHCKNTKALYWLLHESNNVRGAELIIKVENNDLDGVLFYLKRGQSPLIITRGKKLWELTTDSKIKEELMKTAKWKPTKMHSHWYGPFFINRAFAFVRSCKRKGFKLPKDILHMMVAMIAEGETI